MNVRKKDKKGRFEKATLENCFGIEQSTLNDPPRACVCVFCKTRFTPILKSGACPKCGHNVKVWEGTQK